MQLLQSVAGLPQGEKIAKFLKEHDTQTLATGRYELGDNCYVSVSEYQPKADGDVLYEAHERYLDVQYLAYGEECIWCATKRNAVCTRPYESENDYALYTSDNGEKHKLCAGDFMVLYPEDLHAPCHAVTGNSNSVKKLVFKIAIGL